MPFSSSTIRHSLARQLKILDGSILLTPVDSFPIYDGANRDLVRLEGLYATDRPREPDQIMASKIYFSGRGRMSGDMKKIYAAWAAALGATETSMRLLSGLHAHVTIFMELGNVGDTIMLLPEIGGGHFATKQILHRLGYKVEDIPIDIERRCIDRCAFRDVVAAKRPSVVFVDRSEGLVYEDMSTLMEGLNTYAIFDASQYLSGILAGIYKSPFDMGFDLLISTLHKSFPGPQKALVATKRDDRNWVKVKSAMSKYVSSLDVRSTYLAGFGLSEMERLKIYSSRLLENAISLEDELYSVGLPVERRPKNAPPTQHLWIRIGDKRDAFQAFRDLELCRIHSNFRLLPYGLGYGLRLGTTGATLQGLRPDMTKDLAAVIGEVLTRGYSLHSRHAVRNIAKAMADANDLTDF